MTGGLHCGKSLVLDQGANVTAIPLVKGGSIAETCS